MRLEAPIRYTCSCNPICMLRVMDVSGLGAPYTPVSVNLADDHPLRHIREGVAVASDNPPENPWAISINEDGTLKTSQLAGASNPCSGWREWIKQLYATGYRWFWIEAKPETPPSVDIAA